MYRTILAVLTFFLFTGVSLAQVSTPEEILFDFRGNDLVGEQLAYEIKEGLHESTQMDLVDAKDATNTVLLSLNTLDPFKNTVMEGDNTVFSITWKYLIYSKENIVPISLSSQIGIVGSDKVKSVAASIVAVTDRERRKSVGELKKVIQILESYGWKNTRK
jgi:hypothetical protein